MHTVYIHFPAVLLAGSRLCAVSSSYIATHMLTEHYFDWHYKGKIKALLWGNVPHFYLVVFPESESVHCLDLWYLNACHSEMFCGVVCVIWVKHRWISKEVCLHNTNLNPESDQVVICQEWVTRSSDGCMLLVGLAKINQTLLSRVKCYCINWPPKDRTNL